jgi:hypothetical protein
MKKLLGLILLVTVVLLSGCKETNKLPEDIIILPDITGLNRTEIEIVFNDLEVEIFFLDSGDATQSNSLVFIDYGQYLSIGDEFSKNDFLPIITFPEYSSINPYFEVIDLPYSGPYLDKVFSYIDPVEPRGGYFEVILKNCIDGDTAKFEYPQIIYDAIPGFSNNTRFLNMDTEETYGTPEEWGKPGSNYTCDLLTSAESIVLQTDPNDGLIDNEDYKRLLAWVWIQLPYEEEYFLLNYMVVVQGLAQVKYEYGSGETISYGDYTYNEWMHLAEDFAILNELGQWGDLLDPFWNYE